MDGRAFLGSAQHLLSLANGSELAFGRQPALSGRAP